MLPQTVAQPPVRGDRFPLSAVAVQGEHQLRVQVLVEGVLSDEPFQPGDQRGVLTDGQPGFGERSFGLQPQTFQVLRLLLKPGRSGHVGQRWAPPQRHRGRQMLHLLVAVR